MKGEKMRKNDIIKPLELKGYETLIYAIMKSFEKDGTKLSLENIHFKAVEYVLKYPLKIEDNTDTVKALDKIATPNNKTGEWRLKAEFFE